MKLYFRQRKFNKEFFKKVGLLFLVFVAGLAFFEFVLNFNKSETATDMADPTLPTISMEAYGSEVNELHGYVTEMDALYMRDSVIPVDETRELPVTIHTYGMDIDGMSYEIRSTDTERKIAETEVTDLVKAGDDINATLQIENLIDEGEEYLFVITLTSGSKNYYYYTRVLQPVDAYAKECLEFAEEIHDKALARNEDVIATYLETDSANTSDDLSQVSINSSAELVCWGNFTGTIVDDPQIEYTDINANYTSIVMNYQMKDDASGPAYYNVEEYFKVRYTADRMYLLDYERSMEQILSSENVTIADNIVTVGIGDVNMEYLSNETGTVIAFVQAGSLYEYNQNTLELTEVYGFNYGDQTDSRARFSNHDIMLLNIDETGTMDFVVYGYMNSGIHEGMCGINLYHYDSNVGVAEEEAFIQTTNSFQILKASFSKVLYKSTSNLFYIMVDGTLMEINLNTLDMDEVLTGLAETQYAASNSGRYFAWMDEDTAVEVIHVKDLETGEESDITAENNTLLKPISFMEEDLVYGVVRKADITTDTAGTVLYPMKSIIIQSLSSNEILKEYEKSGYYILSANLEGYTLYLDRGVKNADGTISEFDTDTIKDSTGEMNKTVDVSLTADDSKGEVVTFTMAAVEEGTLHHYKFKTAGVVNNDPSNTITVKASNTEKKYFVYVGNQVTYAGTDVTEAIKQADAGMGIVVDNMQQYIWRRGKSTYVANLTGLTVGAADSQESSEAQCISIMLVREGENIEVHTLLENGSTPMEILSGSLKNATVLDLTGCSVSEVLYYVNLGNPVYAIDGNGNSILIIGYDGVNISVYDPTRGAVYKKGMNDATAEFEAAGNVFISYVKKDE